MSGQYHGYTVVCAPSSSGGVTILEMLGILDGTGYEKDGAGSANEIHYLAEAMRRAYADRNAYLGDPDFVKNPIAGLLDPAYLAKLRATIDPDGDAERSDRAGEAAGAETQDTTISPSSMARGTPSPSRTRSTAASATASPCPVWASC